jgi:hypothetical protein
MGSPTNHRPRIPRLELGLGLDSKVVNSCLNPNSNLKSNSTTNSNPNSDQPLTQDPEAPTGTPDNVLSGDVPYSTVRATAARVTNYSINHWTN